jgi:hypothetical protein
VGGGVLWAGLGSMSHEPGSPWTPDPGMPVHGMLHGVVWGCA